MKGLGFASIKRSGVQCYLDIAMAPKARTLQLVSSH
jgi:hypothetical protein